MDHADSGRAAAQRRAAARRSWQGTLSTLDQQGRDAPVGTPADRMRAMWPLILEVWQIAGRDLPTYTREQMPGVVWRPGTPPPEHAA